MKLIFMCLLCLSLFKLMIKVFFLSSLSFKSMFVIYGISMFSFIVSEFIFYAGGYNLQSFMVWMMMMFWFWSLSMSWVLSFGFMFRLFYGGWLFVIIILFFLFMKSVMRMMRWYLS